MLVESEILTSLYYVDWGGSKLYNKWINLLKSVEKEGTLSTLCPKIFSMKIAIYIKFV